MELRTSQTKLVAGCVHGTASNKGYARCCVHAQHLYARIALGEPQEVLSSSAVSMTCGRWMFFLL